MKTLLLLLAFTFTTPSLQASSLEKMMQEQVDFVRQMYADHQKQKGLFADEKRRSEWPKFFSEDLVKELKKEWGFDPLLFAQDFEIKNLSVRSIHQGNDGRGLVLVTFRNFGEAVQLVVACNREGFGFKIENITQPSTGIDLLNDLAN